jgi:hypothetical protein
LFNFKDFGHGQIAVNLEGDLFIIKVFICSKLVDLTVVILVDHSFLLDSNPSLAGPAKECLLCSSVSDTGQLAQNLFILTDKV